ncbi:TAP-like protein-domain-containing protein [Dichotomopilus funicola]|uniref:TAP-like protein-domain-containing protein n=1 Tax=Dichotomopilus funicola TaxID=1934379 RepID=A0AAN6ZJ88_9PEZI|nr:TAP-like protein-domain-containing protein [Dichotomopilus funicola]
MVLSQLFGQLALAATALAVPLVGREATTANSAETIAWGPCDFDTVGKGPIECAAFPVPLDYTDAGSTKKLMLSLIKSPAPNPTKSKKSILFNFGGPGYEAVHTLNSLADRLHTGLGNTIRFSCFDNATDRQVATLQFPVLPTTAYETALAQTFAGAEVWSNLCYAKNKDNENAKYLGTAFVARDLMSVVDALGEDGLLRYWGLSYGSTLGATVAAMFPDRMDRIVLDGVVNSHNYYHRLGIDVDQLLSADDAFRSILDQCLAAGPERCALASLKGNTTAAELEATLLATIDRYHKNPVAAGATVVDGNVVGQIMFITIKYTGDVPNAAVHLRNLVNGVNITEAAAYNTALNAGIAQGNDDSFLGIKCSDTFPRADTLEGIMPDVNAMLHSSKLFGAQIASIAAQCASWPWEAKERYEGNFKGIKTKNPLLLFGNTYDPVTPVVNAKNMSAGFEGSVVVEQHGYGHATVSQPSNCTTQIMQSYFTKGTLPKPGTLCEVNTSLF